MNIYISGLSYGINNADLTNLFAEFGEVSSAKVILRIREPVTIQMDCFCSREQ